MYACVGGYYMIYFSSRGRNKDWRHPSQNPISRILTTHVFIIICKYKSIPVSTTLVNTTPWQQRSNSTNPEQSRDFKKHPRDSEEF